MREVAIQIAKSIENKWRIFENCTDVYPRELWQAGFAVFYSPMVRERPNFLFVGDNPGGNAKDFDPDKIVYVPDRHDYMYENYDLAVEIRTIFSNANLLDQLKHSEKTNRYFFRSPSLDKLGDLSEQIRSDLENFCLKKLEEIILLVKPRIIFSESVGTSETVFKLLKKLNRNITVEKIMLSFIPKARYRNCRIYESYKLNNFFVNGIILIRHLTGSRTKGIYNEYPELKSLISKLLAKDYGKIIRNA